ncbi:DUF4435 domain-containing protein [Cellulophaga baltica]|nr:DUF4435 domain-containing protein [Cellulophaga baltica]
MSKLFSYRNDVDIYTEDKVADKEFYKTLFKNLFGDTLIINDVTPLGCKANVLNQYDNQDPKSKRKKYFIVDGDLDLILGINRKNEKNLIILDSYCIENYLLEEEGIINLIYFSNGEKSKEQHKSKLNFDKWLGYNSQSLVDLFLNFAILRKYGGGPKLKNANQFLTKNGKETILDKTKVADYSKEIKDEIITLLEANGYSNIEANELYDNDYRNLNKKWRFNNDTLLKTVSGKNYLLPLLQFRINHCIDGNKSLFPRNSLKLYLADNSNLNRLEFLKQRIK